MTTPVTPTPSGAISNCSNIVSLSLGQMCSEERAKLVDAILSDPETAALAKFGLRVAAPAQQTASCIVSASSSHSKYNKGWWNARTFVTTACASFALLAIFSFSNLSVEAVAPGLVAMSELQNSDHFGAAGSFEGGAALRLESVERFGSGGFETH